MFVFKESIFRNPFYHLLLYVFIFTDDFEIKLDILEHPEKKKPTSSVTAYLKYTLPNFDKNTF